MCYYMLYDIISSKIFYILPCVMWLVTISSDVTWCVTVWSYHSNPNPSSKNRIKENTIKKKIKMQKKIKRNLVHFLWFWHPCFILISALCFTQGYHMYTICPDIIFQILLLCSRPMISHHVTCHVTAMSYVSLSSKKKSKREKKAKLI